MASSVTNAARATERNSLPLVADRMVKADRQPHAPALNLREVAADARHATMKLETAAASAGISESRLSHKFSDGSVTLAMLEAMGTDYLREFSRLLSARCEPLLDPKARVRHMLREIRQKCDEVEQFLEYIA